ncbi:hypothetical protein [Aquimarina macrocephali]|uniref:hypothetical protein n=1 Tax=Aquimarina macrocephali TaxID=666563 RepID=UPI0004B0984B|nr:hypothetical protein [Aquimarina macrocephali]
MKTLNDDLFKSAALEKREQLAIKGGHNSTRITTDVKTGEVTCDGHMCDDQV